MAQDVVSHAGIGRQPAAGEPRAAAAGAGLAWAGRLAPPPPRATGVFLAWVLACLAVPVLLVSCGVIREARGKSSERILSENRRKMADAAAAMPRGLMQAPGGLADAGGATATVLDTAQGGSAGRGAGGPATSGPTKEEDIVWTNPDDPDAPIPELDSLFQKPSRGPWEQSDTLARQRAVREGKCLLIWFTDSMRSPNCKGLSMELFSTPAFDQWAEPCLVRLRVDSYVPQSGLEMDERSRRLDYVESLRKRHKVMGNPTVVVCAPQGEVIARYRGYTRGQSDFYWGRLKSAQILGSESYRKWRADMEKRGYREWSDRRGRKIFARLSGYRDGELWLVEPDGSQSKTHERKLSEADRLWIGQQKQARGIR